MTKRLTTTSELNFYNVNFHNDIEVIAELAKIIAKIKYATVYSVDKRLVQNHIQKPIKIATIIQGGIHFVK